MPNNTHFVELHARSAFSFLRGGSAPDQMAEAAAEAGLPAMALCDRDGVYGAPRFYGATQVAGIRPIVGSELTLEDGGALPVLVQSPTGYRNLCRLITRAQLRCAKGECRFRWDELAAYAEGLVALTGDEEGPLHQAWLGKGKAGVEATLQRLRKVFTEKRLYIEVQRHQIRGEARWIELLVDLARSENLPLLASNGAAYAYPAGRVVLDVFTCLRHKTHLDAAGRLLECNSERYVKDASAMARCFSDLPDAIANTCRLAEQLEFSLENLGYGFPRFAVPRGETMDSYLWKITFFGADQRYRGLTPKVRAQLTKELKVIAKLGFSGYFLIVWDLINFCRDHRIMVQGRGSAANSAVCYSLGITAVDPIGGKLLFERFLSEGRRGWPDIDLDLPSGDLREQVIQEVYRRYGKNGAAMTANVITYRGRSAGREIGKVLNFSEDLLGRFSNLYSHGDYPHTLALRDHMQQAGFDMNHPRTQVFIDLFQSIFGLPRHLGQHSGGMIICQGALDSVVPLENASMPGRVVAQWDKEDCADMGIIKVDLLGLGMMAVLQDAIELTRERGHPVDIAHIPKDDPATYELMQRADTIGVFQVESRAQMATLPRMKPTNFYDLAIEVAIIRPGPIQGNMVHPYLDRRAGREPIDYIDDRLKPILERTLGVPLFQEQMLQIAMVMADFSGSQAEELRRAIGFHRSLDRMEGVKVKLRQAMERKGVSEAAIEQIVAAMSSFALYGFPESHAISFALIAYASAFLKVHYAAEFYTGLLNNQPMGFYSPATLVQDARRHGLKILPVCVTTSDWECTIESDSVLRLGLLMVKGSSKKSAERMLAEREQCPFSSLIDFRCRTHFNQNELRALASVGALNALAGDRRSALWWTEEHFHPDDLFSRQTDEEEAINPLEMMSCLERLKADYRGMGVTTGTHPMKLCRPHLVDVWRASDLPKGRHGDRVTIAGSVICRQRPGTAKGFVFISLEDETGVSNAIVTPPFFEKHRLVITQEPFLTITGRLQSQEGVIAIKAEQIEALTMSALPAAESHDFH